MFWLVIKMWLMIDDGLYKYIYTHMYLHIRTHRIRAHKVYTQSSSLAYTISLDRGGNMGHEKNSVDAADKTSFWNVLKLSSRSFIPDAGRGFGWGNISLKLDRLSWKVGILWMAQVGSDVIRISSFLLTRGAELSLWWEWWQAHRW